MALARRAQFGMAFAETNEPGIEMNPDGSMEVIAVDGSHSALPGGASFPSEWTIGADGSLAINTLSTDDYALKLSRDGSQFAEFGGNGAVVQFTDPGSNGEWTLAANGTSEFSGPAGTVLTMNTDGSMWFGIVQNIICTAEGFFAIEFVGTPADADVPSSSMILWFDRTDGAAKLRIKAKQNDGTVVTGSVSLAP